MSSHEIKVLWGISLPTKYLHLPEREYVESLPVELPSVKWVWNEMDRIWRYYALDNTKPLINQPVNDFYNHPVWLMNGVFTAVDPISVAHRCAIAKYLLSINSQNVADFGGGFGQLALQIANNDNKVMVSIIEPFPSEIGLALLANIQNIKYVKILENDFYDAILAQDVLEHVEDPVRTAFEIALAVHDNGKIIFANCFFPVIQCHLPSTFHLRHTFPWVMRAMGLRYLGNVYGAPHAQIFERYRPLNLTHGKVAEAVSKFIGPTINLGYWIFSRLRKLTLR